MNRKQQVLAEKHGTPDQFTRAVLRALGEISIDEARQAIKEYVREFREAGHFWEPIGEEKYLPVSVCARQWRDDRKFARVGLTNGCFDVLHAGHVQYLRKCREQCDYLLVLLNSNKSVKKLKGPDRPINHHHHRAYVLAALEMVDAVVVFDETRITKWLRQLKPNVWFKGGDYTEKTLDSDEVKAAHDVGCKIKIIPQESAISTTKIYEKIRHQKSHQMDKTHAVPKSRTRRLPKGRVERGAKLRG